MKTLFQLNNNDREMKRFSPLDIGALLLDIMEEIHLSELQLLNAFVLLTHNMRERVFS